MVLRRLPGRRKIRPRQTAEEDSAAQEDAVAQTETDQEDAAAQTEEPADITLALEEGELTITNQTTRVFSGAELKETETPADEDAQESAEGEDAEETADPEEAEAPGETEAASSMSLVITEENGGVHTFDQVEVENWTDPLIFDEYGFLYIRYTDAEGTTQEAAETAEEKTFEGAVTMYASSNVHIRETADQESESLKVLQLGDEVTGVGAVPGWIKVENDDVTGYVYHSYVTENKEQVDALVHRSRKRPKKQRQQRLRQQQKPRRQQQLRRQRQPRQQLSSNSNSSRPPRFMR